MRARTLKRFKMIVKQFLGYPKIFLSSYQLPLFHSCQNANRRRLGTTVTMLPCNASGFVYGFRGKSVWSLPHSCRGVGAGVLLAVRELKCSDPEELWIVGIRTWISPTARGQASCFVDKAMYKHTGFCQKGNAQHTVNPNPTRSIMLVKACTKPKPTS
jgi:hypothetical protein